jgi:hypothetical protein
MRRNLVTLLAILVAIVAAAEMIRVKQEAAAAKGPEPVRLNGIPVTVEGQQEVIERLKTRIGLLQKVLNEHGLSGQEIVVDDGLQIPGVYPQLIYDKTIK